MKKGLVIIGVILLVVGLLMMLFLWPMIGTIDGDDVPDQDDGTYKVMDELSDSDWEAIKTAREDPTFGELNKEMTKGIDGPGTYVATVEIKDGSVTKTSEWSKVPTMGGILGLILLIVGIVLLLLGFVMGKAAPAAPPMEQPMQQPPMQQQPYQPPPGQQPYQPPPGQQPYQPPPGQPPMPPQ